MLRIITINLNGIRSACNKGFLEWLSKQNADIVCLQEIKAQAADLVETICNPGSYQGFFHFAEKKGYSGVGLYTKHAPDRLQVGLGNTEFDAEGRYIRADFGNLSVISVYLPSGSSSKERQQAKFRFLDIFLPLLHKLREEKRHFVVCGDWNIAHKEIDLKNWKGNLKNSGFLPEERTWLTKVFDEVGYVDVFRALDPRPDQYTWWSNRGQARAKNVGWRIDYQIATHDMAAVAQATTIFTEQRFSDHAPLIVDYDYKIK